jgi:hypothetical protein
MMMHAQTPYASDATLLVRCVAALLAISFVIIATNLGADALHARKTVFFLSPWTGRAMHHADALNLSVIFTMVAVTCCYGTLRPQHIVNLWTRLNSLRKRN